MGALYAQSQPGLQQAYQQAQLPGYQHNLQQNMQQTQQTGMHMGGAGGMGAGGMGAGGVDNGFGGFSGAGSPSAASAVVKPS
eukprot:490536-Pleurochrysis_carterae.AAC.1